MKRIPVLLIASACLVIIACSKDTFETKPKIEITDYNTREVVTNQILNIKLDYFDKEGDLGEGVLTAVLERQNVNPSNIDRALILNYYLPEFPDRDKGEIVCRIPYGALEHTSFENDTFRIKLSVTDRENNTSDTVITEQIVSIRP